MAATPVQLDEKHTLPLEGDLQPDDAVVKLNHDVVVTEEEEIDLYKPLPPLEGVPAEANPLTIRACFVGICLGTLVNASNVYLGLKTGFTFSSNILGAIFGFGILKVMSKSFGNIPILGGPFGPQENSICQAAAIGAGGLSSLFVATLPAMYRLQLLSDNPKDDFGKFMTLCLVGSFFGVMFAVPLRKFFIINVARELRLVFPTSTAVAFTIRSMHAVGTGGTDAMKKIRATSIAFAVAIVQRVVSDYALGILWDWHIFTWFFIWSNYTNYGIVIENWNWFIEWTPAFLGSGLLISLNVGISYLVGTFMAWGVIGPLLVYTGECVGKPYDGDEPEKWGRSVNYMGMSGMEKADYVPSPRFWLLWPGVMVLVCYSMAEFLFHWKILVIAAQYSWTSTCESVNAILAKRGKPSAFLEKQAAREIDDSELVEDFAPKEQQIQPAIWLSGAVAVIAVTIIIFEVQFDINGGLGILASVMAIIFAFLCIHSSGVTDLTPLTASAKASQLVFGGVTHGQPIAHAQTVNLIAGAIASAGAGESNSLIGDYRTGFLLRTPPRLQFIAQCSGTLVAMFIAPGIFLLFAAAYPCILDEEMENCPFPAPSVAAWKAVAQAVTLPNVPIPVSSGIFACVLGALAVVQVAVQHKFLTGERAKYRAYLPNWMAIGVSFVINYTHYSIAMLMGSVFSHFWQKRHKASWEMYCYAIAAGLIAGEGLGGVINAALAIGGVSGKEYGTGIACPRGEC